MWEICTILDLICTILESVWLYYIIDMIFPRRDNFFCNKLSLLTLCIACSTTIVIIMNKIVLSSPYTVLVWMILGIVCSCVFWKGDILSASAIIGTYALLVFIYSIIMLSVMSLIGGEKLVYETTMEQGITRLYFLIIAQTGWSLINFSVIKWLKKEKF